MFAGLFNATLKLDARFLFMALIEKIFRAPPGNLGVKTPVLERVITKR